MDIYLQIHQDQILYDILDELIHLSLVFHTQNIWKIEVLESF